jgi:hypothetical protein
MQSTNPAASTTQVPLNTVHPRVVELSPAVNLGTLWPRTASARRYVFLVAYTVQPGTSGGQPPPRFRAYGVDMTTRAFVFVVDGESPTYLGTFTEHMFQSGALLLGTPPGFLLSRPQAPSPAPVQGFASGGEEGGDSGGTIDPTATQPTTSVPTGPKVGGGGTDPDQWLQPSWQWLLDVVSRPNAVFTDVNFKVLSDKLRTQAPVTRVQVP